ncbi:hypothetical protein [Streptomyces platensis]|uniref:hypothetical protein n=1 Tax=Streptomyces platensis TaxID=58346 RepID=UPI0037ABB044
MTYANQKEAFDIIDVWWLFFAVLLGASLFLSGFIGGPSSERRGWFLYFAAWLPFLGGVLHSLAAGPPRAGSGIRSSALFLALATANLVIFHRDAFPL